MRMNLIDIILCVEKNKDALGSLSNNIFGLIYTYYIPDKDY